MDMENLMAQAQQLQAKVDAAQQELANTVIRGLAGNGEVIVTMNGKYDLIDLKLHPDFFVLHDIASATEILISAYRDAKAKADEIIDRVMGAATAGMPMPE